MVTIGRKYVFCDSAAVPIRRVISSSVRKRRREGALPTLSGIERLLWHCARERPVSECGRLRQGAGGHSQGACRRARASVAYARVAAEKVVSFFTSPEDLRAHIVDSLSRFRRIPSQADLLRSQIGTVNYRIAFFIDSSLEAVERRASHFFQRFRSRRSPHPSERNERRVEAACGMYSLAPEGLASAQVPATIPPPFRRAAPRGSSAGSWPR